MIIFKGDDAKVPECDGDNAIEQVRMLDR